MDEPASLTTRARVCAALAAATFAVLLLVACAASRPQTSLSSANPTALARSIAALRGLDWKQEISLEPGAVKSAAVNLDEYKGEPVAALDQAYKVIGVLAPADDLGKSLPELLRLESLIGYDAAGARATWSPAATQLSTALAKSDPESARDLAAVFASMTALQEQHFRWRAAQGRLQAEDRRSAFAAVAAGDATLVLTIRGVREQAPKIELADGIADAFDRLSGNLPDFLRRRLTFPYRHGSRFVSWAFKAGGWRGVDNLYADPPLSTAEILHPEKYFIKRELPLRLFPPQLLRRFKQPPIIEQTLGEDAVAGLLSSVRSSRPAEAIAAGLRGDQLFHFVEEGKTTTAWFTAWRTEENAAEFLRAYRAALELRHRVRFALDDAEAPALAAARDRGWLLQRVGAVVLLLSSSPPGNLSELAAEAWKDLEVETEKIELRFESARNQLSLRSK